MSFREMPEVFTCDACAETAHLDCLCTATASAVTLLCVRCCGCESHHLDDPGGHAVLAGSPLTWRGLHDSPSRARRHT